MDTVPSPDRTSAMFFENVPAEESASQDQKCFMPRLSPKGKSCVEFLRLKRTLESGVRKQVEDFD
jgi:hypothetical protein